MTGITLARRIAVSLTAFVAATTLTWGQTPEPALNTSAADPKLAWGPCPAPLPAGCQLVVLHGDPAKPGADVLVKFAGKSSFAKHKHTSAERMILLSGELHVTYDGQKAAVVKAGNYLYGPGGRPHSGTCASAEPCLLFIAFDGPVDAVAVN